MFRIGLFCALLSTTIAVPYDLYKGYDVFVHSNSEESYVIESVDPGSVHIDNGNLPYLQHRHLEAWKDLYDLRISKCNLKNIEIGVFDRFNLWYLSLFENDLVEIPENLFINTKVKVLNLANNKISYIAEGAFDNMNNLRDINLNGNQISNIQIDWFKNCPQLQKIYISHNLIESVPSKAFKFMKGSPSSAIILDNNLIRNVEPEAFGNFKRFGVISLSNNQIMRIPEDIFYSDQGILRFNVRNNSITELSRQGLNNLLNACKYVDVTYNPLSCESIKMLRVQELENSLNSINDRKAYFDTDRCPMERTNFERHLMRNLFGKHGFHMKRFP